LEQALLDFGAGVDPVLEEAKLAYQLLADGETHTHRSDRESAKGC
jgi:hypothetical protein